MKTLLPSGLIWVTKTSVDIPPFLLGEFELQPDKVNAEIDRLIRIIFFMFLPFLKMSVPQPHVISGLKDD